MSCIKKLETAVFISIERQKFALSLVVMLRIADEVTGKGF